MALFDALANGFYVVCLLFIFAESVHAEVLTGFVVGVADGDTVTVLDSENRQHKVRLAGIDAPESRQAFGSASKQSLVALVFRRSVAVHWVKTDRFGRIIGKIILGQEDVCLEQVRRGMAWHYKRFSAEQLPADANAYVQAELAAKASHVGLWRDPNPVPPWEFRKKR